ncbi:hypothetical protein K469DRAFT_596756 [Zopfia rhizophila CBS 207.26]|uniref:S-adenosyl-L-methionine-dependent methyltransferase n=1 Tax=Zopfia rhizophila CBS 207.26 TaxID=1314779 RepID=A0A6A6DI83_9PEZI|nr:hypothetical protein K469DRAFT_596756 [Zopfia rhizophila CBS 207.26]
MATAASKSGTNDDNVIFEAGKSEVERLNMQHEMIRDSMTQLILAPIDMSKPGLRILDQATGGGAWLRDVRSTATAQHTYVGTDIEDSYFPSNPPADTSYHHQSMTATWPEDWNGTFDLVHSRFALPGSGTNSIKETVDRLIALVKPGGYIQLVEMEFGHWEGGPALQVFHDGARELFKTVTAGNGVELRKDTSAWLREAGLEAIEFKVMAILIGVKAKSDKIKETSTVSMVTTATGIKETTKKMPPISLSREQLDAMPGNLEKELREQGGEFKLFAIWARKPPTA